jgi:hypothetical protein
MSKLVSKVHFSFPLPFFSSTENQCLDQVGEQIMSSLSR